MTECRCPTCGQALRELDEPRVDLNTGIAVLGGVAVKLSSAVAELCYILIEQYPGFVAHERLIARIWGQQEAPETAPKMIQLYVLRLRRTMDAAGAPFKIVTPFGYGYSLAPIPIGRAACGEKEGQYV